MKKITIKILQDTPFDKAYTILSLDTFRRKYNLVNEHNSDEFLVNYVKDGYRSDYHDVDLSKWFEVIETELNNFKVGDWVWHEGEKKAFCVVTCISTLEKEWRPNYCSFEAANSCTETYKRKADKDEIDYYDLESFCDGKILIGQYKCYYFNNVWKDLIGIHKNITSYLSASKNLTTVSTLKQFSTDIEGNWQCALNGIRVGCTSVTHKEVEDIARKLKLI